ncbi:hypothetical protein O6H91_02G068700 [Diphasiastrum complanatum]|uniref:Uncharacterized protein n=1 Tax=Diphasiastrum complanatum TaxID=34168 RepID=A0ACC2EGW3_DIPCM|nr:hypothetical protein O6H91_02G068700 [Diphasiastrum complanatum]
MARGFGRMIYGEGGSADAPAAAAAAAAAAADENCSYTKVRRSQCSIVQDPESGKPMKRCERTKELLRRCSGRPVEVVESITETTEEDLSSDLINGQDGTTKIDEGPEDLHKFFSDEDYLKFSKPVPNFFDYKDEQSDQLLGGFEDFLHAAEEMVSKIFGHLGVYSQDHGSGSSSLFPGDSLSREHTGKGQLDESFSSKNLQRDTLQKEAQFSDYSKDFREI